MLVKLRMPYRVHSRMVTKLHRSQSDLHERLIQLADRQAQLVEAEQAKNAKIPHVTKGIKASVINKDKDKACKAINNGQDEDNEDDGVDESDGEAEDEAATGDYEVPH